MGLSKDAAPRVHNGVAIDLGVVVVTCENAGEAWGILNIVVGDLAETGHRCSSAVHSNAKVVHVLDHTATDDRTIAIDRESSVGVGIGAVGGVGRGVCRVVAVDHEAIEDHSADLSGHGHNKCVGGVALCVVGLGNDHASRGHDHGLGGTGDIGAGLARVRTAEGERLRDVDRLGVGAGCDIDRVASGREVDRSLNRREVTAR